MRAGITLSILLIAGQLCSLTAQTPELLPLPDSETNATQRFRFQFPRDLYDHPDYQTEWWYFTGNLHRHDRQYGFELTFFHSYEPTGAPAGQPQYTPVIFADLAVSDLTGQRFFFHKALAPQVSPLASITEKPWTIQLGEWTLIEPDRVGGVFRLHALQDDFGVDLELVPETPPVLNGRKGLFVLDASATGAGNEYYEYYSIPRLKAKGSIGVNRETIHVEGLAWNDHEFFNFEPGQTFPSWDWFSIQLDDGASIMLYGLRLPNGEFDPASRGTFVDRDGKVIHLRPGDFTLTPGATWHSVASDADYPIEWTISIPLLEIELAMSTPLQDQEMAAVPGGGSPAYWEGASRFRGTRRGRRVEGKGYLEMLGYNKR
jgi:predicted secreted hydrolase